MRPAARSAAQRSALLAQAVEAEVAALLSTHAGRSATSQQRNFSTRGYVYVWADCSHLQARHTDEKQCVLVIIGATPEHKQELVGFTDGARESAQDWRELLLNRQTSWS